MIVNMDEILYLPGMYRRERPSQAQQAETLLREWEFELRDRPIRPTICFSRKIGVGALEIADELSAMIGYRVIDREVLEYIARQSDLSEKTVAIFDERYPGKIRELLTRIFSQSGFGESDYTRHLFAAAITVAGVAPTIIVGRGTHLILPRDQVLAVRFIGSREYRIKRLAGILDIDEKTAAKKLDQVDREQRAFFAEAYGKKSASPYEFDLVIHCDHLGQPARAAQIVACAFEQKFGREAIDGALDAEKKSKKAS